MRAPQVAGTHWGIPFGEPIPDTGNNSTAPDFSGI